ncbi:MAG TPA: N(4)-(beta-N-acetylglucosaminyl)-L-asparaginase [Candidatus Aminicenantes bacterium]|nr:N(4)-(beta-N-acetylglucosaminyl)-L-asparaginase [Candidatus Aminicenantes bacterium]HRY65200.1 N(4)-(beta-N-acetylglucosaminyl)-L-asparaginase [Candidatus Aminicenantes bacterium]HRZ72332.1 N(4)-(beta-N-acetylglucosaminyl)-L-asparaginase [Candidatus Aminicenantes bacterium]
MTQYSRRDFLKTGAGAGAAFLAAGRLPGPAAREAAAAPPAGPVAVSSGNGIRATARAMEILQSGGDPLDAVIAGVNIVEDDPNDMSVGYGGLPNEDGVVELDASVMYGPTHSAGAVAALRNIKNPSRVARLVMERTDHVLLVGEGALKFARAHGFKEEDLLTEKSREAWLLRKETLSDGDFWFPPRNRTAPEALRSVLMTHGTINCIALDAAGRLAGVTTTSGMSWKLAGRVGDSPIIGAGLYVDNEIGAAGSTGRGEANLQTCASFRIVDAMGRGRSPEQACLEACQAVAAKTRLVPRLCDDQGRPKFGLDFYALNKKGEFGAAGLFPGGRYAVHDGTENKLREMAYLYKPGR